MTDPNRFVLVPALIALQFVAFGWRIAREIALADARRRTWLLACDYIYLMLMLAAVGACVVLPLKTGTFPVASRATIAAVYTFMCSTPLRIAGHYRLFSRLGRTIYDDKPDYPWVTDHEAFVRRSHCRSRTRAANCSWLNATLVQLGTRKGIV